MRMSTTRRKRTKRRSTLKTYGGRNSTISIFARESNIKSHDNPGKIIFQVKVDTNKQDSIDDFFTAIDEFLKLSGRKAHNEKDTIIARNKLIKTIEIENT